MNAQTPEVRRGLGILTIAIFALMFVGPAVINIPILLLVNAGVIPREFAVVSLLSLGENIVVLTLALAVFLLLWLFNKLPWSTRT